MTRFLSVIFALFIVTYMGYQAWRILYSPVRTVSAVYVESEDSIEVSGLVVRDEYAVKYADTSIMELAVSRGERVAKGDTLAVIYKNEEALADSSKAAELATRLDRLTTLYEQSGTVYDLDRALKEINEQSRAIMSDIENHGFEGFDRGIEDLKMKTLSREYIYRDKSELETLINNLKMEKKSYEISSASIRKRIPAESSGYFTSLTDGYEDRINSEIILEINTSDFEDLYSSDAFYSEDNSVVGKIIGNYIWYYAVLTDSANAERFKSINRVLLKFSNRALPDVTAYMARVGEAENNKVLVVFRSDERISEFAAARKLNAEIVLHKYNGLKIPREALRVNENGQNGVYCLIDSQVRFKTVEIIFEKDSYYIAKYDTADRNSLLLYDEIIVSAKDMEHGKVLK